MKPGHLVCLLLFSLLLGRAANFALPAPPPANSLFARVTTALSQAQAGATQSLSIRLYKPAGRETIFRLTITYPSGTTQEVVESTAGLEAALAWVIPPDAGVGRARFTLLALDCGCGDNTLARPVSTNMDKITGTFAVE